MSDSDNYPINPRKHEPDDFSINPLKRNPGIPPVSIDERGFSEHRRSDFEAAGELMASVAKRMGNEEFRHKLSILVGEFRAEEFKSSRSGRE